jgi:peptide-methionine (S)-S-oxide reductase
MPRLSFDRPLPLRVLAMLMLSMTGFACARPTHAAEDLPKAAVDLAAKDGQKDATLVLAGGCFWCIEAVFEQLAGVKDVVSGYAGGTQADADYRKVCSGSTGHAEAIRITYDPTVISYAELLRVFFTVHDPTQLNRQGPDFGPQYRSAIFFATDDEKRVAEAYIKQLGEAKAFSQPIVTTLEPLVPKRGFFEAETYHQNYASLHADEGYIRANAAPKVKKVREKFAGKVKPKEGSAAP